MADDVNEEDENSYGIEAMDNYEDDSTKPLDIIKEYITKDIRERSELNRTEIRGMAMLYSVASELDWAFTKEFCGAVPSLYALTYQAGN